MQVNVMVLYESACYSYIMICHTTSLTLIEACFPSTTSCGCYITYTTGSAVQHYWIT